MSLLPSQGCFWSTKVGLARDGGGDIGSIVTETLFPPSIGVRVRNRELRVRVRVREIRVRVLFPPSRVGLPCQP